MTQLTQRAFDIETTGFNASDAVTVVGVERDLGYQLFAQTASHPTGDIATAVQDTTDEHVRVATYRTEAKLLTAVATYVREQLSPVDVLLVAYNGETWQGGFDLPFLRTRLAAHGIAWPFVDVPYADLLPLIQRLFNTTVDGDADADLVTAYDVLCDGDAGAYDPFDESSEAVTAFETGHYTDVVMHNLADILRTEALSTLAQRYCSKSDFDLKSLTPTIDE
ncbi:3'-5' exonuclease family protein [Halapricum desulfuricans]|uniref:Uncharacterized protein n=1 Tax=Halapricum desulfuricans TaxID=2841257 RepID=A0A897N5B4_9EURY|nr:hypothetical protein [Halapricum desulfuricans]QSG09590.1 Uncharacterized protein HSR122_2209 [Halapricum desulfuricans]